MIKRKLILSTLIIVSFCFVTYCYAQETKQTEGITSAEVEQGEDIGTAKNLATSEKSIPGQEYNVNFVWLIIKTIFSLLIITGLIYFLLRFFLKGQRWLIKPQEFIQVIATHPLSPNKYIQIVEIGNKLLVLGVSEHNINLLTEIVDKEVIDTIKIQVSRQGDKMPLSFVQHLKNKLYGQEVKQVGYEEKLKFLNKQRERLGKLEAD